MKPADYRIESSHPISFRLLPTPGSAGYVAGTPSPGCARPAQGVQENLGTARRFLVSDAALAVVMAAKSVTVPPGQEIRVVHVPTGEVVFRKSAAP